MRLMMLVGLSISIPNISAVSSLSSIHYYVPTVPQ